MGKRHHGLVFMPGKFVFPGGSVDPADRKMTAGVPLDPSESAEVSRRAKLQKDAGQALAAWDREHASAGAYFDQHAKGAPVFLTTGEQQAPRIDLGLEEFQMGGPGLLDDVWRLRVRRLEDVDHAREIS